MSIPTRDWELFPSPEENSPQENGDSPNYENDGMFFGSVDDDNCNGFAANHEGNDEFDTVIFKPQSLNVRSEHGKLRDQFRHHGDFDDQEAGFFPAMSSITGSEVSQSYAGRKIHDGPVDTFFPGDVRRRRASNSRRGCRNRSDSDSAMSAASHDLVDDFDEDKYNEFKQTALQHRTFPGADVPEMNALFRFWCYYLRKQNDPEMQNDFLNLAKEDYLNGRNYGLNCFFRMCSYSLDNIWDPERFEIFQQEAINAYNLKHDTYGIEKFMSLLKYNKLDREMPVSPEMNEILKLYPTLDCFKPADSSESGSPSPNKKKQQRGPRKQNPNYANPTEPRSFNRPRNVSNQRKSRNDIFDSPNSNNRRNVRGNQQRNGGNQNRGARGGYDRNLRYKNDEPRNWNFGSKQQQPASAPKPSLMRDDNS